MQWHWLAALIVALSVSAHAQWQTQTTDTHQDLHAVYAISGQIAWAAGAHGTVLRTDDGGATWIHCVTPAGAADLDLRAVQPFNAVTALVMSSGQGALSRIYRTSDGCRSWDLVLSNPDPEGVWQAMQFRYQPGPTPGAGGFTSGVLLGRPVEGQYSIFTSRDYGATWQSLQDDEQYSPGPSADALQGESLPASGTAMLTTATEDNTFAFLTSGAGGGGRLLYPQGHREEFNSVSTRYSFANLRLPTATDATAAVYSLATHRTSAERLDMVMVGGDLNRPEAGTAMLVRRSGVKGLFAPTVTVATHPPHGLRLAVGYDADLATWITVGPNGTDLSQDDGRNWTPLVSAGTSAAGEDSGWQAMSLPFAVGVDGRIGRWQHGKPTPMLQAGTGGSNSSAPAIAELTSPTGSRSPANPSPASALAGPPQQ